MTIPTTTLEQVAHLFPIFLILLMGVIAILTTRKTRDLRRGAEVQKKDMAAYWDNAMQPGASEFTGILSSGKWPEFREDGDDRERRLFGFGTDPQGVRYAIIGIKLNGVHLEDADTFLRRHPAMFIAY